MSIDPGSRFGPYVVEERLGQSDEGERWTASEPGVDRPVALTLTPLPEDAGEREAFRERIRRRAGLEHPGLAPVYGAGEQDGRAWIATRMPVGRTLDGVGALPPARRARIGEELRSALRALAAAGLAPSRVSGADVVLEGERAYLLPADESGGSDSAAAERDIDALVRAIPVRRSRRRALLVAGAVAILAAAATLALVLALHGGEPRRAAQGPAGTVVARIPFGTSGPFSVTFDGERAWAVDIDGRIVRLDPKTNTIAGNRVKVARFGGKLLVHDGSLWLGPLRVDPETLRVTGRLPRGKRFALDFAFAGDYLWVAVAPPARGVRGQLLRFDPKRLRQVGKRIRLPFGHPASVVGDADAVWVATREGGTVTRVDARTGAIQTTTVGFEADFSSNPSPTGIWVPTSGDGTVVNLDRSGRIRRVVQVGGMPLFAVASGDSVWIEDFSPPQVRRIEVGEGRLAGMPVPLQRFGNVYSGLGDLWVTQENTLIRIHPTEPPPATPPSRKLGNDVLLAGPVPAGRRLRTDAFADRLTLEIPSDAWVSGPPSQKDAIFLMYGRRNDEPISLVDFLPRAVFAQGNALQKVTSARAALAALRARRDLAVSAPRRVRVAGVAAVQVDVRSIATKPVRYLCDQPCSVLFPLSEGLTIDLQKNERLRVLLFDHGGRVHYIAYDRGARGDAQYRNEAERIIDSIRFEDGG